MIKVQYVIVNIHVLSNTLNISKYDTCISPFFEVSGKDTNLSVQIGNLMDSVYSAMFMVKHLLGAYTVS